MNSHDIEAKAKCFVEDVVRRKVKGSGILTPVTLGDLANIFFRGDFVNLNRNFHWESLELRFSLPRGIFSQIYHKWGHGNSVDEDTEHFLSSVRKSLSEMLPKPDPSEFL